VSRPKGEKDAVARCIRLQQRRTGKGGNGCLRGRDYCRRNRCQVQLCEARRAGS
jgi:hypothetical protein